LAAAARASLDVRASTGKPGGWTSAWLVALWARLFEPEKASAVIRNYLSTLVSDNLLHRDGDIFQIDANFGMTGCISELLLQSHTNVIRLLPALPSDWPDGAVRGLCARGGLTFDLTWAAGNLTSATVHASHPCTFQLAVSPDRIDTVTLAAGDHINLLP
jgi:alpha-L-fucosidase 2